MLGARRASCRPPRCSGSGECSSSSTRSPRRRQQVEPWLRPQAARGNVGVTADATPMVRAEGVHKSFGRIEVLRGIDLEVAPREVMCIIGPSGSGKSTFLRCINHLEKIDAGRLSVDGELVGYRERGGRLYELPDREVCRKRAEIGMVFQQLQPVPPHDRAGERHRGAGPGEAGAGDGGVRAGPGAARPGRPGGQGWTPTRVSSRAASSSGSPSPGRWPCSPS